MALEQRGNACSCPARDEVYEGMIVGRTPGADEMARKSPAMEKSSPTCRSSHGRKELERLTPHLQLSLEQALEFIGEDECVEVSPHTVRLPQGRPRSGHPWSPAQPVTA